MTTARVQSIEDIVDRHLRDWAAEFSDLDLASEGVVERIQKLARYFTKSCAETAADYELTLGDWQILSALRRLGPPYELSPGRIADDLMLSPAAVTNRLDRLEHARLVERHPDPSDRRALKVRLSDEGKRRWGAAVGAQSDRERRITDVLSDREKETLNKLLRKLMVQCEAIEGPVPPRRDDV